MTRSDKVLDYLNGYHDGFWDLGVYTLDGVDLRIAENVIAWFDLGDTKTNRDAYVSTVRTLVDDGRITYSQGKYSGKYALKVT